MVRRRRRRVAAPARRPARRPAKRRLGAGLKPKRAGGLRPRRKGRKKRKRKATKLQRQLGKFNLKSPQGLAAAQAFLNQQMGEDQGKLNRPASQETPYGSMDMWQDEDGNWHTQSTLSDEQQSILDQQQARDQQLGGMAADQLSQFGQQGGYDISQFQAPSMNSFDRKGFEDQLYEKYANPMMERFAQEEQQFNQAMADRGATPGSPQWQSQFQAMKDRQNDALSQARASAVEQSGGEQQRQFGLASQAHNQAITDYTQQYQMPLNTYGSLAGGIAGVQNPSFAGFQPIQQSGFDIGAAGLGFANLQQQGGGGGGGPEGPGYFEKANFQHGLWKDRAQIGFENQLALAGLNQGGGSGGSGGDYWGQVGSQAATGVGQGIGAAVGGYFGS